MTGTPTTVGTAVSAQDHMAGVLEALRRTGHHVGDGVAPSDVTLPYSVVYDLSGGGFDGPVDDPDADVDWPFQVTCVGETPEQARALADKNRRALVDGVAVAGRDVLRVEPDGGLGGVQRDDTTSRTEFYLTPRWRLHTTPA